MTTINGHRLTTAQLTALHMLTDYLRSDAGREWLPNCSPSGKGRWIDLVDVFPRSPNGNVGSARRNSIHKLHALGVLKVCEVAMCRGWVKAVPCETVDAEQAERERRCVLAITLARRLYPS